MEGSQRNPPPYAGGVRGGVAPPAKVPLFASAFPQRQPSPPSSGFQGIPRRDEQSIDGNWPNNNNSNSNSNTTTSSSNNYSRGYGVNIPMGSIPALPGFPATSGFSPYIAPQQQQGVGGGEPGAPAQLNIPGNEFAVPPYQLQRKQQQPPFQSPPSKINPFPGDLDPPRSGAAPLPPHQRHHADINFNSNFNTTANVSSAQPTRVGRPIQPLPANPTVPTSSMQPPNPIPVHPQLPGAHHHQLPMYPTAFTAYGTGPRGGGGGGVIQRQKPELVPPANWGALQTASSSSHSSRAEPRVPPTRLRPPSPPIVTNSVSISVSPHPSTKPPQATPQVPAPLPPTAATGGGGVAPPTIGVASPPAPPSTQKIVYIPPSPAGAIIAKRFRTKLCGNFMQRGTCPFDQRCMFAHGEAELRSTNQNFRDGITTEEAIRQFQRGAPLPIVPTSTSAPAPTPASASDSVPPPPPAASLLQRESPVAEADPLRVDISPDESSPGKSTPPSTNPAMSALPQPNLPHPRLPSPLAAGAEVRSLLSIYQRDDDRQTKMSSPGSQQQQQQPPEEFIQTQSTSVLSDRSGSRLDSLSGSGIFASQQPQQSISDQRSSPPTLTTGGSGGDLTSGVSIVGVTNRGSGVTAPTAARGTGRALSSPSFTNSGDVASEGDPPASAPALSGRLQRQRSSDGQAHYRRDPYAWNLRTQLEEEQGRK